MQDQASPLITSKLPLDAQGFVESFDIDDFDPVAVKKFYQKYGIVIFNNVLNQAEIKRSVNDLWKDMEEACHGKIKKNDRSTWQYSEHFGGLGFVNHKPIVQSQLCKNRSHPKIYKAFKCLYELTSGQQLKQPLLALFDRGSILRPSKHNPEWKSPPFHHFDIHPWWWTNVEECTDKEWRAFNKYNSTFTYWLGEGNYVPKVRNFTKLQGVLGLSPTNPESGGFQAVCGFHNYIGEWCKKNKEFTQIEQSPQLLANMQKNYQRAGSVILFSRELPHNIFPNVSQNPRYAQYLRMAPQSTLMLTEEEKAQRKIQVKKMMHKDENKKDPIVREVYMIAEQVKEDQQKGWWQKMKEKVGWSAT